MNRALGAIPSGRDYRDAYVMGAAPTAPLELPFAFNTVLDTPMDQNQIPACVSHSIVDLIKLYWFNQTGKWIDFSPRFLDILSMESWMAIDAGRRPRVVLKVAANQGCCTTATLPNNTLLPMALYRDPLAISQEAYAEAAKYRIPGYIRVEVGKARDGIYFYGAISSTYAIGTELYTPSWMSQDIDPLRTPKTIIGGHQMTPFGWNGDLNKQQNEWGVEWDMYGRARYDEDNWSPYTLEQWAIADLTPHLAAFLKELPSPSEFKYQWRKNLRRGDEGVDVKWAQVALMIDGFLPPLNPEELGFYGAKTTKAVESYQLARGIKQPFGAAIGPLTRGALNAEFAL